MNSGHDLYNSRRCFPRLLSIHKSEPRPPGNNINRRSCVLLLAGKDNLGLQVWVPWAESLCEAGSLRAGRRRDAILVLPHDLRNLQRPRPVVSHEVLRNVMRQSVVILERNENAVELPVANHARAIRPHKLHPTRLAWLRILDLHLFLRLVDGILSHAPIRRPLAAGDGDQAARTNFDDVLARQRLGAFLQTFGISDEGPDAGPGRENL
mmetsp:Transcript_1282/g.5458  ORF Transcript_1282/g.5458 Transcript_1282/m.5458 type:complete len:209 (-) Transcript_1282:1177-1803(-)